MMVHVLATVTLAHGKRAEWLAAFKELMPLVHAEAGCIEYGAAVDIDSGIPRQEPVNPDEAVIIEKWASLDHLKAHLAAPHMAAYRERIKGLVLGVKLRILGAG
jgi:quinol monooxygenase YgiN